MINEEQDKQRTSCVTLLCSEKKNSELNAVDSKINSAVSARPKKCTRTKKERQNAHVEVTWKESLGFKVVKLCFKRISSRSLFSCSVDPLCSAQLSCLQAAATNRYIAQPCNYFLDYIEPLTPKMDAKSTVCLSDVNHLRAFPARDTIH